MNAGYYRSTPHSSHCAVEVKLKDMDVFSLLVGTIVTIVIQHFLQVSRSQLPKCPGESFMCIHLIPMNSLVNNILPFDLQDMYRLSGLPSVSTNHNEGLALKVHCLLLADLSQDTV